MLPGTTVADILAAISAEYDVPSFVDVAEIEDEELAADHEMIPAYIRSLLTQIGSCYFTDSRDTGNGGWARMHVRYTKECDARRAVQKLNQSVHGFLDGGRLTVRIQDSATLKVSTQLYERIKPALETVKGVLMHDYMAWYNAYADVASGGRFTIIKVRGQTGGPDLAAAMDMVISITEGNLIANGGQPFWIHDLANSSAADQKLHNIEKELGILLQRDVAKRELRWYGSPEITTEEVQQVVLAALRKDDPPRKSIELTPEGFVWACRGGMAVLSHIAAPDTISLDVLAKRILVHGSTKAHRDVLALLALHSDDLPLTKHSASADCTICLTEAVDSISTDCGHIYCQECFTNLCSSVNTTSVDFSITCKGNSDWCQVSNRTSKTSLSCSA